MARPHDMPAADRFTHGTRARYVCGCRCAPCRAANTLYARDCAARAKARATEAASSAGAPRRPCAGVAGAPCPFATRLRKDSTGDLCAKCRVRRAFAGLVSSDAARAHLLQLAAVGVGKRAVHDACDVPMSMLHEIRLGRKPHIRVETERRILEVDAGAIADHATVPAGETWRMLGELLALGIPKYRLARLLGSQANRSRPSLQIRPGRVLAKTEQRVRRLHREMATALLRAKELQDEFSSAAERGREFFAGDAFSFITRKSSVPRAA